MAYKEFIAVLGLSRSGTTLLASLLHAYPEIEVRFEPWHSMSPSPPAFTTADWFEDFYFGIYGKKNPESRIGGFKETFGGRDAISWTCRVLNNIHYNSGLPVKIIVIIRDVVHAYLSNISGYHNYWEPDPDKYVASEDDFLKYSLPENIFSIQALIKLQQKFGGIFVSYKRLIENPNWTMNKLTDFLGLDYKPDLLEYYKHINLSQVMGDKGVSEKPKIPSYEYYERRAKEAEQFEMNFPSIKTNGSLSAVRRFVNYVDTQGVASDCKSQLGDLLIGSTAN